ncbi:sensor histidine kinase [Streptomyces himalayensis]|uniref:histidine kinase n=1 Tax=Streptomyces himalayensis subsp. himalayensis TaxID=2756131 RepID=A0A7W0DGR3_9ACTN|nr:nitrate- and nitrite sensing domain-containing protein [Streptomyces himalayensis]MBA2944742.1 nitrate- and nitrite sensing domain-containing protein [Streptomyces himalayensis subsp. himalayensis]
MQGRFKRDGSAAAEQEPHGGTDRGSSPQHAQSPGPGPSGDGGERGARTGAPAAGLPASQPKPKAPVGPGSRIALRNWRISTRLVALMTLPVVAATSLGALRISESMDDIQQLDNMKLLTEMTKQATDLAAALQDERDQSAGPLSHGGDTSDFSVKGPRETTDNQIKAFVQATRDIQDAEDGQSLDGVRDHVLQIQRELATLRSIRQDAYTDRTNSSQTVDAYSRLIEQLLSLSTDMAQATSNPEMIQRTRALAAFSSAKEYASVQRAIIAAALPANDSQVGKLSETDRRYASAAADNEESERTVFTNIYNSYGGNAAELTKPIDKGNPTITAANAYAKGALREGGLRLQDKRSYKDWVDADSAKIDQMAKIELTLLDQMEQKARELRNESEREAYLSGAVILLVLGISLVGAFVVARSMIRSLRRLQDTATRVAQDRLPELVKELSESDPQDVDTSVESVGVHSRDEIGQVAAAFDDVHREAVRLAAEQALLRGNVNAMFTNLSRRSQGLIQRQLSLISELESREADPDQLSSLFKLDHLATRMRRNGENLLVLAGEEPGRRWTRPVPLVDVLRAAASEVEQYERIELASVPATEVAGRVVNDLVHLLAELLENATSFSSPQTKVKVTGHALPDGRVLIEIHDTGIGLSPEDLAAINERLASPPTVDVSVSRRMGLFVVGRLSQRHGIRIQLRPSDSGGTTALVMLPVDVAQGGKKAPGKPGPGGSGGPAAAQAAAGAAAARRGVGAGASGAPNAGRLGAGPAPRGQVGAGAGPRAALPSRDPEPGRPGPQSGPGGGGLFGGPQDGPSSPSQQGPGRPAPAGAGAGAGAGMLRQGPPHSGPRAAQTHAESADDGRTPQLPPRGGPRAELPGGNPKPRVPSAPAWSNDTGQPAASRASLDTPRGHEEPESTAPIPRVDGRQGPGPGARYPSPVPDDRQGPGSTAEFARPDFDGPRPGSQHPQGPGANAPGHTGQFVRPDVFGDPNPSGTGQFPVQGYQTPQHAAQDSASTGQFERPGTNGAEPRGGREGFGTRGGHSAPRPPAPRADRVPQQPSGPVREPEALPPAGPGDGRTPLYDTLETNWFRGQQGGGDQPTDPQQRPPQPQAPATPAPPRPAPTAAPQAASGGPATTAWRSTPNDELVRQAERVRKPTAGGVTTSGLPRRVPRANLVAGTAQQQQHQTGPQVSRAPDDVRGRLTNLRRGIQQGRQAGTGQTGSFPRPTHQQER